MDCQIIQWNCRSIVPKKSDLIYLINKFNPLIIVLSETWLKPGYIFGISGFTCIREDRADGYGGVAILVKNTVSFSQITFPPRNRDDINIVGVYVDNITIISVYLSKPSIAAFDEIKLLLSSIHTPFLLLGDFNSHHQSWGSTITNSDGEYLLEILDSFNLCVLNTGAPTRRTNPNENFSAVDLSICTPSLASLMSWSPLTSTFGSDHFPLIITSPIKGRNTPKPKPRIKHKLYDADWSTYKTRVEFKITQIPDLNELDRATAFAKCIIDAADEIFPIKDNSSRKIPFPPWWDSECAEAVHRRKMAEKEYACDMSDEKLLLLQTAVKSTRELLREKKQQGWKAFCSSLSPNTSPSLVWRNIKRFRSAFNQSSYASLSHSMADAFLDRLAPPTVPEESLCVSPYSMLNSNSSPLGLPFSMTELKGVLASVRDSSPGQDSIIYSFITHLNDKPLEFYLQLINDIMLSGKIPSSWRSQEILPILKPDKPSDDATSYRPIALSSVLAKIAEHLVKNRLEWFIESNQKLSNSQFGFRKGKSTMDSISILTTDIRTAFTTNKNVVAAFLDISSAYDNVNILILRQKLDELCVPHILINFIMNILSERIISLEVNNFKISRTLHRGLPQGCVLSPLLYNIYVYDLESSLQNTVNVLQYADDLLLYAIDGDITKACNILTFSLKLLNQWLNKNGLDLSPTKSEVVIFSRKRSIPSVSVSYNNEILPQKNQARFLGVILDSRLSGLPHFDYISAKCEKLLNMMRCLSGVWWGAHTFCLKLLYDALIRSVLDYGTFLLDGGSIKGLKKLDAIQSKALRIMSGAMRSSPINGLQVECGEPPLHLRRQYLADRFLIRALQFSNHFLFHKLDALNNLIQSSRYWTHKAIPCLIKSFRKIMSIESHIHRSISLPLFVCDFDSLMIEPSICYNTGVGKHDVEANTQFNFNIHVNNWSEWHHIYTDASKIGPNECVGVGVIHKQYNILQMTKLPPESSVFTGECFGLLKAVEYILLGKLSRTIIFTDSKSALQTLDKFPFKMKPYYPIIFEIRKKLLLCKARGYSVVFSWIPGHSGIVGNERADQIAKNASTCGDIFPYTNYCYDLLTLPKVHLQKSWNSLWIESAQVKGRHYFNVQPSIPLKPWFSKVKMDKRCTSIIIRMRLGHVCTPSHLARLGIVESNLCECGEDVGDLDHIFFSCSQYDHSLIFQQLLSAHVPLPTSITCLISNPVLYHSLLSSFIIHNNIKV